MVAERDLQENSGFTPEQARAAVKEALKTGQNGSERGSKRTQEAKEKIQRLMALEVEMIANRNRAKTLQEQRKEAIKVADQAHKDAEKAAPADRLRMKGIEYSKTMAVANISGQIEGIRYQAQRRDAERVDLEQEVRRKLGITGGWKALVEWGGAKINNALNEINIIAEEKLPFGMGVANGEEVRANLSATGRA